MCGECKSCWEHCLDCKCASKSDLEPLCCRQRNGLRVSVEHLNPKQISLSDGIDPPHVLPERKIINVNGRSEHEAIILDAKKCQELGLDQCYEVLVYLDRLGGWLESSEVKPIQS
jgi:hypothetical protein